MLFVPGRMVGNAAALSAGSVSYSAEATQFFSRISDPGTTRKNLYAALIDSLVSGGVWSKIDALYVLAAPDEATSLVNLKQSSYALTKNGTPTFTADDGFKGTTDSTTQYLSTGFTPSTAGGSFAQNSAHLMVWSNESAQVTSAAIGVSVAGSRSVLAPRWSDNNCYYAANCATTPSATSTDAAGCWIANRSASNAMEIYKDGSSIGTSSAASTALQNQQIYVIAERNPSNVADGYGNQVSAAGYGGSLSAGEVTTYHSALATYRTGVGL
jgi:hypothetical protein